MLSAVLSRISFSKIIRHSFPLATVVMLTARADGAGIFRDGQSARTMALGGAATAGDGAPIDALAANPAALGAKSRTLQLGLAAGFAHGTFTNRANANAEMNRDGLVPNIAFSLPVGRLTLGLGVIPDATLRSDWRYRDTPGGLDGVTTLGTRTHKSEIILFRTAFAASWKIHDRLSIGGSAGFLYNRNRLEAPYIIQSQPALAGAKTLLDLETEGTGGNAQFGVLWKLLPSLKLGASYTLASRVKSYGRAFSDARVQLRNLGLSALDGQATFDAEVTNQFPKIASAGLAWQTTPRLLITGQVDWINWADAFETLEVRLRHTNNRSYRLLLGGGNLDDDIPLHWRDQWVWRIGAEFALSKEWTLRAGYSYASNPVPGGTLTPLTAVVMEHTIGAGIGWRAERYGIDLAWQWQLPNQEHIGRSELRSGEYSDSDIEAGVQWIGLTTTVAF
ncbi:MAG: outer membrane protein transport protein [Chthoniobacteraceae bacterium]